MPQLQLTIVTGEAESEPTQMQFEMSDDERAFTPRGTGFERDDSTYWQSLIIPASEMKKDVFVLTTYTCADGFVENFYFESEANCYRFFSSMQRATGYLYTITHDQDNQMIAVLPRCPRVNY